MDTRFWGPDGWKLLHSIAFSFPNNPTLKQKTTYKQFFTSIKYILPCIYCRNSFRDYLEELPLSEKFLKNSKTLSLWLYKIHNKVNDKLRKQGLNEKPDPTFNEVYDFYSNYVPLVNAGNCANMPGINFLYSVVFNFPVYKKDIELDRYSNYVIFFNLLKEVIPFTKYQQIYSEYLKKNPIIKSLNTRKNLKIWLFKIEKDLGRETLYRCPSFEERCNAIEKYRAGCGTKKDKKPTCRLGNMK